MKTLFFIPITAMFLSCGTQKEVANGTSEGENTEVQTTVEEPNQDGNYRIIGVVHLEDGCGAYIDAEVTPGEMKKLYPVNLEDQFKVEGAKIKFDYALSRAMVPEGCIPDMTVSVSDVTRLRN